MRHNIICKSIVFAFAETVQLTVVTQTTIDKGPETTQTKKINEDVTLDCSVLYDPTFSLTVEWKKDNVEVEIDDERITIDRASVGNQALTIREITYDDAGNIPVIHILINVDVYFIEMHINLI